MAKFFKTLFTTSHVPREKKKDNKVKESVYDVKNNIRDEREFTIPYDTKRKLSVSRSGRMKQNVKNRGKLDNIYRIEEKKEVLKIEYEVNKINFHEKSTEKLDEIKAKDDHNSERFNNDMSEDINHNENYSKEIPQQSYLYSDNNYVKDITLESCTQSEDDDNDLSKFDEDIAIIMKYNETNF